MKKIIIFLMVLMMTPLAMASEVHTMLEPVQDAWVHAYYPNSNMGNSGWGLQLIDAQLNKYPVYNHPYNCDGMYQFDLTEVTTTDIDDVQLCAFIMQNYLNDTKQQKFSVSVHDAGDVVWDETTVTWNTKPAFDSIYEDVLHFSAGNPAKYSGFICWDVTNMVEQALIDGDSKITLYLRSFNKSSTAAPRMCPVGGTWDVCYNCTSGCDLGETHSNIYISSKENGYQTQRPYLEINWKTVEEVVSTPIYGYPGITFNMPQITCNKILDEDPVDGHLLYLYGTYEVESDVDMLHQIHMQIYPNPAVTHTFNEAGIYNYTAVIMFAELEYQNGGSWIEIDSGVCNSIIQPYNTIDPPEPSPDFIGNLLQTLQTLLCSTYPDMC